VFRFAEVKFSAMDEDVQGLLNAMRQENSLAHDETRHYFDVVAEQLHHRFDVVAEQLQHRFDVVAEQLRHRFDGVTEQLTVANAETRDHFDAVAEQLRHRFDVVAEQLEGKIALVAEGVVGNNERIDRLAGDTKAEFAEVRSLIKLSYAELDRRIRALKKAKA
jgi:hypothetical protein